jgi:hypothetical protein
VSKARYRGAVTNLEPEALTFLWSLVEAARSVPRAQRGDFLAIRFMDGNILQHPGLPGGRLSPFDEGDLRDLVEGRFVRVTARDGGDASQFELRQVAFDFYNEQHRNSEAPIAGLQQLDVDHISSDAFGARYPEAIGRWRSAVELLWGEESAQNLTDVGHRCREAMQLFVTCLIELCGVSVTEPDPTKTVARLRAVIAARKPNLSDGVASFLDALLAYWGTVSDLVQRQEHGSQKEGGELSWDDARRVLLYTAMVMSECDRVLS